jgi:hypothetical protein
LNGIESRHFDHKKWTPLTDKDCQPNGVSIRSLETQAQIDKFLHLIKGFIMGRVFAYAAGCLFEFFHIQFNLAAFHFIDTPFLYVLSGSGNPFLCLSFHRPVIGLAIIDAQQRCRRQSF